MELVFVFKNIHTRCTPVNKILILLVAFKKLVFSIPGKNTEK